MTSTGRERFPKEHGNRSNRNLRFWSAAKSSLRGGARVSKSLAPTHIGGIQCPSASPFARLTPASESITPGRFTGLSRDNFRASRDSGLLAYVVMSYATPIAWALTDGTTVVVEERFSATTSRHQSVVRLSLR